MLFASLDCPQCGAPLPRQAAWRIVTCTYCGNDVTRCESLVRAAPFHEAYQRAHQPAFAEAGALICGGQRYRMLAQLGQGENAKVVLAERLGPLPARVVIKLAQDTAAPGRLAREVDILTKLQAETAPGSAYFSRRLPQPISYDVTAQLGAMAREVLVLRSLPGFWGSLAAVRHNYPQGIDARHAVWMWRRVLEVLGYIHQIGWTHGRLSPDHLLVHPQDHGILIIGWGDAKPFDADARNQAWATRPCPARDLAQAAWSMRALLAGGEDESASEPANEPAIPASTPAPLAAVLQQASEDFHWCARLGAAGLDAELKAAARSAFGPPQFVRFTPTPYG